MPGGIIARGFAVNLQDTVMNYRARTFSRACGFTLIEVMITVVIIAILAAVALPNYNQYVLRSSRQAAQTALVQLASLQEKIYLNSNAYAANATSAYTGTSTGGLGITSGLTSDRKYTITATPACGQTYTITATPVAGSAQAGDGTITIDSAGSKLRGGVPW